jgi:hypothetical protein
MDQQSTPLRGAETLALKAFQGAFPMNGGATNDFAARAYLMEQAEALAEEIAR